MPDENTVTTDTTAPADTVVTTTEPVTPPAEQQNKLFTQAEVNRIVGERVAKERASRKEQPKANAVNDDDRVTQLIARERAFTRATTSAGLNDRQMEIMGEAMKHANPENVSTWCADYLDGMGLGKKMETKQPEQPTKPPATAPTAPTKVDPLTNAGLVDIFNLSPDQVRQMGPQTIRTEFEKILTVGNRMKGAPPRPTQLQRK